MCIKMKAKNGNKVFVNLCSSDKVIHCLKCTGLYRMNVIGIGDLWCSSKALSRYIEIGQLIRGPVVIGRDHSPTVPTFEPPGM